MRASRRATRRVCAARPFAVLCSIDPIASGFPIGFVGNPQARAPARARVRARARADVCWRAQENPGSSEGLNYIYNHVNIKIAYHTDPDLYEGRRIVGFEVEPGERRACCFSVFFFRGRSAVGNS